MTDLAIEKKEQPELQASPMNLLAIALQNNAAIDVIERLSALQERALQRDAEQSFNVAMNAAQADLGRIAPDLNNPQTKSKYASYSALDRVLRPIYTRHGFSLSFDSGDSSLPDTVLIICYVSHRDGHTRKYQGPPMPSDGKGAKGGDVMTKTHATGAAMSYGMRYLLKFIFNVAVGEDDTDGNIGPGVDPERLSEHIEWMACAKDMDELRKLFTNAYREATEAGDKQAQNAYISAKNKRRKEE
jgi:hypothetical protein